MLNNQNLILVIRGNGISGAPSIKGTNQFPMTVCEHIVEKYFK